MDRLLRTNCTDLTDVQLAIMDCCLYVAADTFGFLDMNDYYEYGGVCPQLERDVLFDNVAHLFELGLLRVWADCESGESEDDDDDQSEFMSIEKAQELQARSSRQLPDLLRQAEYSLGLSYDGAIAWSEERKPDWARYCYLYYKDPSGHGDCNEGHLISPVEDTIRAAVEYSDGWRSPELLSTEDYENVCDRTNMFAFTRLIHQTYYLSGCGDIPRSPPSEIPYWCDARSLVHHQRI